MHSMDLNETPAHVVIACADIMTGSNMSASSQIEHVVARSESAVLGMLDRSSKFQVVVVDLQGFPELPKTLRSEHGFVGIIIGFAPHVRTDLLDGARPFVTSLKSRGAIIQRFDEIVSGAMERARHA